LITEDNVYSIVIESRHEFFSY